MSILFRRPYSKRVADAVSWIQTVASPIDTLLIECNGTRLFLSFDGKVFNTNQIKNDQDVSFIIKDTMVDAEEFEKSNPEWKIVFKSQQFCILEKKGRYTKLLPIRFGLDEKEQKKIFEVARSVVIETIKNQSLVDFDRFNGNVPERFNMCAAVGVALWVNGSLRGSMIYDSTESFFLNLVNAASSAVSDWRFKPITQNELESLRVEITVISDVRLPVREETIISNEIDYEKGYKLLSGTRTGWYVPEVFNCQRFLTFTKFRESLLYVKAGMREWKNEAVTLTYFMVQDFIESTEHSPLPLRGPVVRFAHTTPAINLIPQAACASADWLSKIQNTDGDLPTTIPTWFTSGANLVDWPRFSFTMWALSEFATHQKNAQYQNAARSMYAYIQYYLIDHSLKQTSPTLRALTYAYTGNYLLHIGETAKAFELAQKIIPILENGELNILAQNHIASFLLRTKNGSPLFHETAKKIYMSVWKSFLDTMYTEDTQLATYAELGCVSSLLESIFPNENYRPNTDMVFEWLLSHQNSDGSFKATVGGGTPYTRGTTKIFEVLSLRNHHYTSPLEKNLKWILEMQYNQENSFFLTPDQRNILIGGLRSEINNPDAHIDSSGHFLLGVTRILSSEKTVE